jgi:hypothetical protein
MEISTKQQEEDGAPQNLLPRSRKRRKLPDIPIIIPLNGGALIPSSLPVQGWLTACSNTQEGAGHWHKDEEGIHTYTYKKSSGTTRFQVHSPILPPSESYKEEPKDATADAFWEKIRIIPFDLDGDVFLAMLAQALGACPDKDGYVWITSEKILRYRGISSMIKRNHDGRERRAGDRQEDLKGIAACVRRMENTWITVRQWILGEGGEKHRRTRGRIRFAHESHLIQVAERISQDEIVDYPEDLSGKQPSIPVAWRYKIGTWIEPFLKEPNRQVAWLLQQALSYDPYHEKWEKRLARYFTFHLRINISKRETITRKVGDLIDELSLPVDHRHPERTKQRFGRAMDRLVDDGQISSWKYAEANALLPASKWLETWRAHQVVVAATAEITSKYHSITERVQLHRNRALALKHASSDRRRK